MKPFNLEEAKAGKAVCTRDGKDVRIICWDWKNPSSISIIALVKEEKDGERIQKYTKDGKYYADGSECDADLFMKPITHKGFAWVSPVRCIYEDEAEAMYNKRQTEDGYFLAKIEWEE